MKCSNPNCKHKEVEFPEHLIELSHDVPKYLGGTDKDGRHWICKDCHYIYERLLFAYVTKNLPENIKTGIRQCCKYFANQFFKEVKDGNTTTT